MDNVLTYIKWRGDISLTERPFNEVDNLILAILSYIDFSGIAAEIINSGSISINDAYNLICDKGNKPNELKVHGFLNLPLSFFKELAYSKRFRNARISNYKDICNNDLEIQFAALHIELDDGTVYIAFRGTDQTILGWREDFSMSFQTVPAQHEAVKYLEDTMSSGCENYRIGGHSKGGNLAVYSAMMCEDSLKNQIIEIYDNDGPGFCKEMISELKYQAIQDKVIRIIPEFSVIGMLFDNDSSCKIVKSSATGIMQHDPMTWKVEGEHFFEVKDIMPECKVINQIFDTWLENVNMEQRRIFTKNFFDGLEAGGARLITDIANGGVKGFESILITMFSSEKDTKIVAGKLVKSVIKSLSRINFKKLCKTRNTIKGTLVAFLGLFFMKLPEHSLPIMGMIVISAILAFSIRRLIYRVAQNENYKIVNKYSMIFYTGTIGLVIFLVLKKNALIFSVNFSLGAILISIGVLKLKNFKKYLNKEQKIWILSLAYALLFIVFGIVAFLEGNGVKTLYVFVVGAFLIIEGLYEVIVGIIQQK